MSASSGGRNPIDQKIGDYYAACMDESRIETLGARPLDKPRWPRSQALADKSGLADRLARLQSQGLPVLFGYGSLQDFKDATKVIAVVDQGGLGLPDRDYYLKDDAQVGRAARPSTSPTCRRCSSCWATSPKPRPRAPGP